MQQFLTLFNEILEKLKGDRPLSLGIDHGTHALRYVLYDTQRKEVVDWRTYDLGQEQGKDAKKLAGILKEAAKNIPAVKLGTVGINVQGQALNMGRFSILNADKAERDGLIKMALKNLLPYKVEDASYYCQEYQLALHHSEEERKSHYHFVSVQKQSVNLLTEELTAEFKPIPQIVTQGYAHEAMVDFLKLAEPGETIALLNVGRSITAISVYQNSKLLFQREIPLAGQDLTRAILIMYRDPDLPEKMLGIQEAEELKKEMVIPIEDSGTGLNQAAVDEAKNRRLHEAVKGVLSAWIQDIRLTFNFFYENYEVEGIQIKKIYVLGGSAKLKNLIPFVSQHLHIPAAMLELPEKETLQVAAGKSKQKLAEEFHEYGTALAFALKKDYDSNLNVQKRTSLRVDEMLSPFFRVIFVFFSLLFLFWFVFLGMKLFYLKDVVSALEGHQKFLQKIESPYMDMLNWQNYLQDADDAAHSASYILKVISFRTPGNVLLSDITIDRQGQGIELSGFVYGDPKTRAVTMTDFAKSLKESRVFRQIEVPRLDSWGGKSDQGVFRLTASVTKPLKGSHE